MLRNFRLGKKLTLGFSFVLLLGILVTVVGLRYMGEIADSTKGLFEEPYTIHTEILRIQRNIIDMDRELVKILLAADPAVQQEYAHVIAALERETLEAFTVLSERFTGDMILLEQAQTAILEWRTIRDEVIRLALARQFIQATTFNTEKSAPQVNRIEKQIEQIVDFARNSALDYNNQALSKAGSARATMIILLFALFLVAMLATWQITGSITKPLAKLVTLAQGVAQGDLSMASVAYGGNDEIGVLTKALNEMRENLRGMALAMTEAANLAHSSAEQLSAATQESSASAEELANTSNQFATAVARVSGNAQGMATSARKTNALSAQGAKEIQRSIQAMDEIRQVVFGLADDIRKLSRQSEEIGDIVTLITGIAEQTNLLALNATIEAARAGEQGRGFAVVADEVRRLAEQSAGATAKVTDVIQEIRVSTQSSVDRAHAGATKVQEGVSVVAHSGQMFAEIATIIEVLVQEISDVALASQELAAGAEEMGATTEEQSATTEQMAASAVEVTQAATTVYEQMNRFKI